MQEMSVEAFLVFVKISSQLYDKKRNKTSRSNHEKIPTIIQKLIRQDILSEKYSVGEFS